MPERAVMQAHLALDHIDDATSRRMMEGAKATAERLGPAVLVGILYPKANHHNNCLELEAARDTGRRALVLLRPEALWERAGLLVVVAMASYRSGRFAEVDALLAELALVAERAGHHGALAVRDQLLHNRNMMLTGDLRAWLEQTEQLLPAWLRRSPLVCFLGRMVAANARLYLGEGEDALDRLSTVAAASPQAFDLHVMAAANLFAGTALIGGIDRARALFPTIAPGLPVPGRRYLVGTWFALEASVAGLALVGDRDRCGALYPLTRAYVDTGLVCYSLAIGPGNPQLAAAIAAEAGGHTDHARQHFETALEQARDLPDRILQPTVLYWYGRALHRGSDVRDHTRGRAMVDAALTDFRALGMIPHAALADRFLQT